jgi:hypothetical protein
LVRNSHQARSRPGRRRGERMGIAGMNRSFAVPNPSATPRPGPAAAGTRACAVRVRRTRKTPAMTRR